MSNWKPIEEAPQTGEEILLFTPGEGLSIGKWDAEAWGTMHMEEHPPSHFMLLPQPPEDPTEDPISQGAVTPDISEILGSAQWFIDFLTEAGDDIKEKMDKWEDLP